ncbi:MAG: hydroxymethylglutaryl-CoA lyase [Silvanigrellaceae bacterium]
MNVDKVVFIEVGPRDGFQGESKFIPTHEKLRWIQAAVAAGAKEIQLTSFVNNKIVPQMADAEDVCAGMLAFRKSHNSFSEVKFSALALNTKGVERAIAAGVDAIDISMSASETHSLRNTKRTQAEAFAELEQMTSLARAAGIKVRAGLQCAFGCGYEGRIPTTQVIGLFAKLVELSPDTFSLADSTGMAHPHLVSEIVGECLSMTGERPLVLHLHDTFGRAMLNLHTALELGVRHFDTAFGGLGGCPFIPGATGNIATEDVASLLHDLGFATGYSVEKTVQIRKELSEFLGRELPGKARG